LKDNFAKSKSTFKAAKRDQKNDSERTTNRHYGKRKRQPRMDTDRQSPFRIRVHPWLKNIISPRVTRGA
jgi:hypothetical protein